MGNFETFGDPGRTRAVLSDPALGVANPDNAPLDDKGEFSQVANPSIRAANENPGALAGATGAISNGPNFKTEEYRIRFDAARALIRAIRDCHPDEAVPILEAVLDKLRPGQPIIAFRSLMEEAGHWAALATRNERKCYALAAFLAMSAGDRRAFLAHLHRLPQ